MKKLFKKFVFDFEYENKMKDGEGDFKFSLKFGIIPAVIIAFIIIWAIYIKFIG